MFYERYTQLCKDAGIAPSAAATKAGFSRGTVSVWKKKYEAGQDVVPDQDVIDKVCTFFGCAEPWLRGIPEETEKAPAPEGERVLTDDELKVAYFRGADPTLSDEDMDAMWDDAKNFRDFIIQKRNREKHGN